MVKREDAVEAIMAALQIMKGHGVPPDKRSAIVDGLLALGAAIASKRERDRFEAQLAELHEATGGAEA